MGRPTLPHATVRRPAARSIASSIWTVVVLPFVPVTASHGVSWSGSRSRQASSTSPHTGMPREAACASNGASGRHPGEVTTTSTSSGRVAVLPGPRWTEAPRTPSRVAFSGRSPASDSSSAVTEAPRWVRLSAAAKPETPKPATTARTPSHESCRPSPSTRRRSGVSGTRDPLGVEEAEPRGDEGRGDQPEPHDDGDLLPAEQLEVMVQWSHPEEAFALRELEVADLQDHRGGLQ